MSRVNKRAHLAPANHLPHIDADEYHFDCEDCRRELKGLLKGSALLGGVLFESTNSTLRDAQAFAKVKALILDKVYSFETFEKISELLDLRGHKYSDPTKIIEDWRVEYPELSKTWTSREELLDHQTKVIKYYEDKIAELYTATNTLLVEARGGSKLFHHAKNLSRFLYSMKQNRPLPPIKEQ